MKPSNAKDLILRILGRYEQIYAENVVLKLMLSTCSDSRVSTTWEETLNQLLSDQTARTTLHANFDELRAQVEAAIDEEAALQLLLKMPTTGKPN